jgi:hypothetical protein
MMDVGTGIASLPWGLLAIESVFIKYHPMKLAATITTTIKIKKNTPAFLGDFILTS